MFSKVKIRQHSRQCVQLNTDNSSLRSPLIQLWFGPEATELAINVQPVPRFSNFFSVWREFKAKLKYSSIPLFSVHISVTQNCQMPEICQRSGFSMSYLVYKDALSWVVFLSQVVIINIKIYERRICNIQLNTQMQIRLSHFITHMLDSSFDGHSFLSMRC